MSGGSMDYIYCQVAEAGRMTEDPEIKCLLFDLSKLLHDEEWARSSDYSRDDYLRSLMEFKERWFGASREERLKQYVDEEIDAAKARLYNLIGCKQQEEQLL